MFSSGDIPLYLADIHTCSSIALKSRITHTGTVQASTCRVDGWIYDTAAAEERLSAARCFPQSVPDVSLLLQCSGSSAWTFPIQEALHVIWQGDDVLPLQPGE